MLKPLRASEIAKICSSQLIGADFLVAGACTLDNPRSSAICFAMRWSAEIGDAIAAVEDVLLLVADEEVDSYSCSRIPVSNPRQAFAKAITAMLGRPLSGIAKSASIHPTAKIAQNVVIGENVVVGADSSIGEYTELRPNVVIGSSVRIGSNCLVKSCSVIGQEGFGISLDEEGNNLRIPHIGGVQIGNFVEIGALNTVCAGTIDPTIIEDHVKTDDHVHIGHNVYIGENCLVTACSEISGSVTIGRRSWLGPNCSVINGIEIGSGVFIGLAAVVIESLPDRAVAAGSPARILRISDRDAV